MQKSFIIGKKNCFIKVPEGFISNSRNEHYVIYTDRGNLFTFDDADIFIDGYVIPRNDHYNKLRNLKSGQLIYHLFKLFGPDFIKKIKGFHLIVICTKEKIYIYNDIHSVKRFCYINDIISNNFKLLCNNIEPEINDLAAIQQALFQHFLFGQTLVGRVKYSEYASLGVIDRDGFNINKYWNINEVFAQDELYSITDFSSIFNLTIRNYFDYLTPINPAITITGGRDTRSILAAVLNNGVSPHTFTFGNPANRDVITGKMIADACGLSFSNPWISDPTNFGYKTLVQEIINLNNPFINIHRAHRLDAIKKELSYRKIDMLLIGAMGGDYIKGTSFDDYIVSTFIRRYFKNREELNKLITDILDNHCVKYNENQTNRAIEIMLDSEIFRKQVFNTETDVRIVHEIIGCTHDIQDINIFSNYVTHTVAPFMDIDIIEALFKTQYSLITNSKNSKNPFIRYLGGELQSRLIIDLCPRLKHIPFASFYTPSDATQIKPIYFLKRLIAEQKHRKCMNVSGFSYSHWFHDYVNEEINNSYDFISKYYDIKSLQKALGYSNHLSVEGYWHKFSNPIMLSLYTSNFL